jgi:hypothetical protein
MLRQISLLAPKHQFVGMRLPLRMLSTKPLDNETPDYYRTLGVPSDASLAEVKAAYRQLGMVLHALLRLDFSADRTNMFMQRRSFILIWVQLGPLN